jgi:hypothetical protein
MASRSAEGRSERLRIVVSGMIAADPGQGGAAWAVLQYVLGLRGLGHDVYFVEPLPTGSIAPYGEPLEDSANAAYFRDVASRFDLTTRAALLLENTRETIGVGYDELKRAVKGCDLLINISGMLAHPALFDAIPRRVYLDLDPAFNQLWHAVEHIDMRFDGHTHFFTVGGLIGTPTCSVPTCGRTWQHVLQPIVLKEWPVTPGDPRAPWTTIGNWRGYGSITHEGVLYGQKAHSFRRLLDLPARSGAHIRPALMIHRGEKNDLVALRTHRWDLVDPAEVAPTPDAYRQFVQWSKGELGIAKSGYVESRCGWFSDRSVCYLASGRPVVAQDTGFGAYLPTGEGLFAFSTVDEAAAAMEAVEQDYARHCRRARELAAGYFRSERVLGTLLELAGAAPAVGASSVASSSVAASSEAASGEAAAGAAAHQGAAHDGAVR